MEFRIWREMAWLVGLVALWAAHLVYGVEIGSIFTVAFFGSHPLFSILFGAISAASLMSLFFFGANWISDRFYDNER